MSFLTVLGGKVLVKGCVQWKPEYDWKKKSPPFSLEPEIII